MPSVRLTLVMNGTWASSARPYIRKNKIKIKKVKKYYIATEDPKKRKMRAYHAAKLLLCMTSTFAGSIWIGERRACKGACNQLMCASNVVLLFDVYGMMDDGGTGLSLYLFKGEGGVVRFS
jgi:hypothetical protein